jgi:hypothetical protein
MSTDLFASEIEAHIARQVNPTCDLLIDTVAGNVAVSGEPLGPLDRLNATLAADERPRLERTGTKLGPPDEEQFAAQRAAAPEATFGASTAMATVEVKDFRAVLRGLVIVAPDGSVRVALVGRVTEPPAPLLVDLGCADARPSSGSCVEAFRQARHWLHEYAMPASVQLAGALRQAQGI